MLLSNHLQYYNGKSFLNHSFEIDTNFSALAFHFGAFKFGFFEFVIFLNMDEQKWFRFRFILRILGNMSSAYIKWIIYFHLSKVHHFFCIIDDVKMFSLIRKIFLEVSHLLGYLNLVHFKMKANHFNHEQFLKSTKQLSHHVSIVDRSDFVQNSSFTLLFLYLIEWAIEHTEK